MQIRAIDPKFLYYFNIFFKKTFVVSKILFTFAPEKFESMYSGNATKRSRGVIISRSYRGYFACNVCSGFIIVPGVGWLSLLILT